MPVTQATGVLLRHDGFGPHSHTKIGYVAKTHGLKGEVTSAIRWCALSQRSDSMLMFEKTERWFRISWRRCPSMARRPLSNWKMWTRLKARSNWRQLSLSRKSKRQKLKRGEFYMMSWLGLQFMIELSKLGVVKPEVEKSAVLNKLVVGEKTCWFQ